jgi:hypothetical protein
MSNSNQPHAAGAYNVCNQVKKGHEKTFCAPVLLSFTTSKGIACNPL